MFLLYYLQTLISAKFGSMMLKAYHHFRLEYARSTEFALQ